MLLRLMRETYVLRMYIYIYIYLCISKISSRFQPFSRGNEEKRMNGRTNKCETEDASSPTTDTLGQVIQSLEVLGLARCAMPRYEGCIKEVCAQNQKDDDPTRGVRQMTKDTKRATTKGTFALRSIQSRSRVRDPLTDGREAPREEEPPRLVSLTCRNCARHLMSLKVNSSPSSAAAPSFTSRRRRETRPTLI